MKLHFAPRTRATRARWILEELELPYELVKVEPSAAPVLVDGEVTLTSSLAICLYLADGKLAPAVGSGERGAYYQWMVFAETALDPVVIEVLQRSQAKASIEDLKPRLTELFELVDRALGGREFAVGSSFTAADVVLASVLHLAHTLTLLEGYPRLFEYTLRHAKRPAVRRAVTP